METHIYVYGQIGSNGITADFMRKKIANSGETITVHINSPGGEVYEGYTIYNLLRNSGKPINVIIEGLCASIATLIACAGDHIKMNPTAEFMIHNPMVGIEGSAEDLRKVANQLDNIKQTIIQAYKRKTSKSEEELWKMMDAETFLSAEQAKQFGFVDEVEEALKFVAYFDLKKIKPEKTMKEEIAELFTKFENKIEGLLKKGKPKNMDITLEDGTKVFIETEDEILVGKAIFIVTPEGNKPAPAGSYGLPDGRVLVVAEEGVVAEVKEPEAAKKPTEEELQKQIENLTAQLAERDLTIANNAKEVETIKAEAVVVNAEITNLKTEFLKIKNTALGSAPPKGVVNIKEEKDTPQFINELVNKIKNK
jgi:ATP-dependent Clp endopeptidase proteolytic subunit ClpP